jgi:hypothetical protein
MGDRVGVNIFGYAAPALAPILGAGAIYLPSAAQLGILGGLLAWTAIEASGTPGRWIAPAAFLASAAFGAITVSSGSLAAALVAVGLIGVAGIGSRLTKSSALRALTERPARTAFDGLTFAIGTILYAPVLAAGTWAMTSLGVTAALLAHAVVVPLLAAVSLLGRFPGAHAARGGDPRPRTALRARLASAMAHRDVRLAFAATGLASTAVTPYAALVGTAMHADGVGGPWLTWVTLMALAGVPVAYRWERLARDSPLRRTVWGFLPAALGWCVVLGTGLLPSGTETTIRGVLWVVAAGCFGVNAGANARSTRDVLFRHPDVGTLVSLDSLMAYGTGAVAAAAAAFVLAATGSLLPIALPALVLLIAGAVVLRVAR